MSRLRDITRWGSGTLWANVETFTGFPVTPGLHTIQVGHHLLDLLIRDRQSPVTLVAFHASVKNRSTVPYLVGDGLTDKLGINLISLADPTIALDGEVRLGWFIGNRFIGDLRDHYTPVIRHVLDILGTERTILWGASGGGFGALRFAPDFPDSLTLTINSRIHFTQDSHESLRNFIVHGYNPIGRTPFRREWDRRVNRNMISLFEGAPLPAKLLMYQNRQDLRFYDHQHLPFIEAISPDPNLYHRLENDGPSHVPIPRETHLGILGALSRTEIPVDEAIELAGFTRPSI